MSSTAIAASAAALVALPSMYTGSSVDECQRKIEELEK